MSKPTTIKIDDIEYVRADEVDKEQLAETLDGKRYVIIRSYGAGVFAGYLRDRCNANRTVILDRCQRLWRWTGATLSQVSRDGIAGDEENKFSIPIDGHEIFQVLEIIPCTEKARIAIHGVKSWEV